MDPTNSLPRFLAPRPLFMSENEQKEYEEIWKFLRDRQERGIVESSIYCRFYNMSSRDIDAIWCRGENEEDYIYMTIPPKRYFEIRTYEGHPWIFRASEDGERMVILKTGQRVHYPCNAVSKIAHNASKIDNTPNIPVKLQAVMIRSPKAEDTSLKQLCIRQISRLFSTDFVSTLPLPASLQSELLEYYINKISYVNALCPSEENMPEKEPALKTVESLKRLLHDLESQSCGLDLREKLRDNMQLFTKIDGDSANSRDGPSTSANSSDGPSTSTENNRKRPLEESSSSTSSTDNQYTTSSTDNKDAKSQKQSDS